MGSLRGAITGCLALALLLIINNAVEIAGAFLKLSVQNRDPLYRLIEPNADEASLSVTGADFRDRRLSASITPASPVHDGGVATLRGNDVRRSFSSSVEVSGTASSATLTSNVLCDGVSGVGLLVHRGADGRCRLQGHA